jgi:hypothetical protein
MVRTNPSFNVSYVYGLGNNLKMSLTEPLLGCELKRLRTAADCSDIFQAAFF